MHQLEQEEAQIQDEDLYEKLSEERKKLQEQGDLPDWITTGGWQLLKQKYLEDDEPLRDRYMTIASTAALHAKNLFGYPTKYSLDGTLNRGSTTPNRGSSSPPKSARVAWRNIFFEIMWNGWLSPATPVLTNMGTNKGCPVSCSGNYVPDSIAGFYLSRFETAMLTKNGFGTSSYLGDIRARGTPISRGGAASGSLPVLKMFVQDMRDVSQGNSRRGAWAGYLEIDHDDFYEWVTYLFNYPDDVNIGWILTDEFIERLNNNDKDAIERYQKMMKVKMVTGKGYIIMIDKINRQNPEAYKKNNLQVRASNLCSEIMLHSDEDHTFTCVLSSLNLSKFDEWKGTSAIFNATVFLDCVAEEFIRMGKNIPGLEKSVRFTEKGRALGLGVLGFHTYLQSKEIPIESLDAHMENNKIFKKLHDETLSASKWMAKRDKEPEWCKGLGIRNTHRMAIAPTASTALICGGVSQGIEPIPANVYNQNSAGGEIERKNPNLVRIMEERHVYNEKVIGDIIDNKGSVAHVNWLSDEEKKIFKTAFEIDQRALIRLASTRQKWIDQGQSLNLFFAANEDEEYISEITAEAISDPYIKALYYYRSMAGIQASKGECEACES